MEVDTIIIGAGAAGLMCAVEAGKRRRKVLLIEQAGQIGKKILISGGGRCNFTNINCTPKNYISLNPHFCKSALSRYTPYHFIELVEKYNISYHEKTLGQQFCDDSSRQIVSLLKNECDQNKVEISLDTTVIEIRKDQNFFIKTNKGEFICETLVIATGGISIPKMGATDFGYKVAKQFGISVVDCYPGLVPFTLGEKDLTKYSSLSGVALPVVVSCHTESFKESMLFTHKGLSGPSILQISSYWKKQEFISVNLSPETIIYDELKSRKLKGDKAEVKTIICNFIPKKLAEIFSVQFALNRPINQISDKELESLSNNIHNWQIQPNGTEGYAKAEVTVGGVNTDELSSKTMESKNVSGLFFIGEVVDVTGHLGGFNFQWAWASGYVAGQYC